MLVRRQTEPEMANAFYTPGAERAAKDNELFATIAPRYDLMNDLQSFGLHRRWKERVIQLARARPGERALDLCCGTGDLALALARNGAKVVGLDFNRPMLDVARQKQQAGIGRSQRKVPDSSNEVARNPEFVDGDAQRIPFADNSFEIVTVGYGLRNLASWETGIAEMRRVAKPGGRLLVLDFGKPDNPLWRGIYFGYLKLFVPLLGRVFCGNAPAYSYILESLRHYPSPSGVAQRMRELKLTAVQVFPLLGGVMTIHYAEKPAAG
jgi:demethylmenaquinone methyltransferase/2-methoxy-6-polyprenyl-1,4-benzoquinol methylase